MDAGDTDHWRWLDIGRASAAGNRHAGSVAHLVFTLGDTVLYWLSKRLPDPVLRLLPQRQHPQNRLLLSDKLLHTHPRQSDHFSELLFVKYLTLRRGLHLDQLVARGHYKIHVHISA